jgi:hypothetical protein
VAGFFINWLTGTGVRDTQSGFRAYPAGLFSEIELRRGGFVLETEIILEACLAGYEIVETPVTAIHEANRRSRFRPLLDGCAVGLFLARHVLGRMGREGARLIRKLATPFSPPVARRRRADLAIETLPYRDSPARLTLAAGTFLARRIAGALRDFWSDPGVRQIGLIGAAALVFPLLVPLMLLSPLLARASWDPLTPCVRRFYSQDRLARAGRRRTSSGVPTDFDVLVVGGGPAGATAAACLAQAGLRVACFERERFPRFHVGESLLPGNLPLFERLGVHEAIRKAGFLVKYGATFADEQEGNAHTFYFAKDKPGRATAIRSSDPSSI